MNTTSPAKMQTRPSYPNQLLTMLYHIGAAHRRDDSLTALAQTTVDLLTQHPKYTLAIIYLPETTGAQLQPAASSHQKAAAAAAATLWAGSKNSPAPADLPGIQSRFRAPLDVTGNNVPGLLSVESDQPDAFTPEDEQLITIVAGMTALAINNRQLIQQQQQERKISATLQQISATLISSLRLDKTLTIILASLEQILSFDSAAIYLLTPDNRLRMVAGKGMPHEEVTMASAKEVDRFPLDEAAVSSRVPLAVSDVRQDPRWTSLKGTEYIRSWLGVPLIFRDLPIGLVTIDRSTINPFSMDQITLAEAFASYAAIALENARLFSQVKAQEEHMRKLSLRVVEAQEEERRRISRELHDEMGQALTAIKLNLQMLLGGLAPHETTLISRIDEIIELANDSIREVRRLAMELRPSILDDLGLGPTLHWYQNQFQKRSATSLTLSIAPNLERLAGKAEIALYRVVQEALTNVSRHANAGQVEISLSVGDDGVYCSIIDDGDGFPAHAAARLETIGVGLTSMVERIEALKGQISIESNPGAGTSIFIHIPAEEALNPAKLQAEPS